MRHGLIALCLMLCAPSAFAQALRPGPGQDVTEQVCGICHTVGYIRMNAPFLTSDQWKGEITKMRTAFGAPIDDETAATVLAYLNQAYGPAR